MSAEIDIVIPDIGDVDSVEVIEVLVGVGDTVAIDDSLVTLESDKASMEVPAAQAGQILALTVEVGAQVSAGDVIGKLTVSDQSVASEPGDAPAAQASETSETVTSQSTDENTADETRSVEKSIAADAPAVTEAAAPLSGPAESPTAHLSANDKQPAHASPAVRRYAREHGVALNLLSGTGRKNRILKEDVRRFIKESMESATASYAGGLSGGTGIPELPTVDFSRFGEVERVELSRINRVSAENLHRAWLNLPMVTHHEAADITEMEAFRKSLKSEAREGDAKITGLAFHIKALANTLKAFPKVNSSMAPDGKSLFLKKYFHIGIAVDTPNGLVVPVLRDVDRKTINELAVEMKDISSRAREKKLKPDEMQGASITISSLGGIGGTAFTPIINPPEVAILGISRAQMQPVWNGAEFIPRLMCPLALTYDHRVIDGADAARFMVHYGKTISDIRRLLL